MKTLSEGNFKLVSAIRTSLLPVASSFIAASPFLSVDVFALPQGGQVKAGQASITQTNNRTVIHQHSNRAAIQWNSFNINANESVNFHQPSASSSVLNRIVDQNPSKVLGNINSNGQVFLINPNGIVFGKSARVNVAGIVASSLNITTDDFMAGRYTFTKNFKDKSDKIINKGLIKASSSGVVLVGSNVMNEGKIYAKLGNIALVSANKVSVDFDGDGLIQFEVDKELIEQDTFDNRKVTNTGEIISEGGHVLLQAQTSKDIFTQVVNNEGVIKASRIENRGGEVFLLGGEHSDIVNTGIIDVSENDINKESGNVTLQGGNVISSGQIISDSLGKNAGHIFLEAESEIKVSGILSAKGKGKSSKGGKIKIVGEKVALNKNTNVDASGNNGGGEILIGGNFQGKGETKTSNETKIAEDVEIKADAIVSGDGGKIIVWSDKKTSFKGDISAQGGKESGDGGFIEVSGKKKLKFEGTVDTNAENGKSGILLLDPEFIKVAKSKSFGQTFTDSVAWDDNNISFNEALDESITITKKQLEDINADVILQATVGIEFEEFVLNMENNLTLETRNSIANLDDTKSNGKIHGIDVSNATINLNNGKLVIVSGQNTDGDNDISTSVKLGKISAKKGIDVSSSNSIVLRDDISSDAGIQLSSNTDSISNQVSNSGITLEPDGNYETINISSKEGDITLNGKIDGKYFNDLAIVAKKGSVSVNEVSNVYDVKIESKNLSLKNNVSTNRNLNLSSVDKISLDSDVLIKSDFGDIDLSSGINSEKHKLGLESNKNIKLGESLLKELAIHADSLQVSGNITTKEKLDFSLVKKMKVEGNVELKSNLNDINLSKTDLTGDATVLNAVNGSVSLGSVDMKELTVFSKKLELTDDIKTNDSLYLNDSNSIELKQDVELTSRSGTLFLNSSIEGSGSKLSLNAQSINLGLSNLKELKVSGNSINIMGDVNTTNDIDFSSVSNTKIIGARKIESIYGNINFSKTDVTGEQLKLQALKGNVQLGKVDLHSLSVHAHNANLFNDIQTKSLLDLNNASTVILYDSLTLKSESDSVLLNTEVFGWGKNLSLEADNVSLGLSHLNELQVKTDTLTVNNNLSTVYDIDLSLVKNLNVNNYSIFESSKNNIYIDDTNIFGSQLSLQALNGDVILGQVNLESLKVGAKNAYLSNDIKTNSTLDFNDSKKIILKNDLSLSSNSENVLIESDVDGSQYKLTLSAEKIDLGNGQFNELFAEADDIQVSGNLKVNNNLVFKVKNSVNINKNRVLESIFGNIDFSQASLKGDVLTLKALNGDISLDNVDLQALTIYAQNANLYNDIQTKYTLDLNEATTIVLNNSLTLSSKTDALKLKTNIEGNDYDLILDADNMILDKIDINNLFVKRDYSTTDLYGDITSNNEIVFAKNTTLNLHDNVKLSSKGTQILSKKIKGNYNLTLETDGGRLDINEIETASLKVNNSLGITNLYDNIISHDIVDLSQANQVNIMSDVSLESLLGNIDVSNGLKGSNHKVYLKSFNDITLGATDLNSLTLDSKKLNINSNITTNGVFDSSKVDTTIIDDDLSIISRNDSLFLSRNIDDSSQGEHTLNLKGLSVDVNNIGSGTEFKRVKLESNNANVSGNVTAVDTLDFNLVKNLDISNVVKINSKQGDIDLSSTNIVGDELSVISKNNVELGSVNLNTLTIESDNISLSNDVYAKNSINLDNASKVVLESNVNLESQLVSINTDIFGTHYDLALDARTINLENLYVNKLSIDRNKNSHVVTNLNGDIRSQSDINFSNKSTLNLINNTKIISKGDQKLSDNIIGLVDLSVESHGGKIDLHEVNVNSLKLVNSGRNNLHNNISTNGNIDFSKADNLNLRSNIELTSNSESIQLTKGVKANNFDLSLNANLLDVKNIDSVNTLNVNAQSMMLNGDISSSNTIDLSKVKNVELKGDSKIEAVNLINLSDVVYTNNNKSITLDAKTVNINKLGDNGKEINNVVINSNQLNIYKQIVTQGNINFNKTNNIKVFGNVSLNTSSGDGLINLSNSNIAGDNLIIDSGLNNVLIGKSDTSSLKIISKNTDLYGDLNTDKELDLSNSNYINVHNDLTLTSKVGMISMNSIVNVNNFNLNLDADKVLLGSSSQSMLVNKINLSRKGGVTHLFGSVEGISDIDFSNNDKLILENDIKLSSKGGVKLSDNIIGNHSLFLSSGDKNNTGYISLSNVNLNNLIVENTGVTELSGHLSLIDNADLSKSSIVQLGNDSKINSKSGNIFLETDILGSNYRLDLNAGKNIILDEFEVGGLSAKSQRLELNGRNVSISRELDFSEAKTIEIKNDLKIDGGSGVITLGDIVFSNDSVDLEINAKNIQLNKVSGDKNYASSIKINSRKLNLNDNIKSSGNINIENSEIKLNDNILINTVYGDINLNKSNITGLQSILDLTSAFGSISLGKISEISALNISANNVNLTDSVSTLFDQDYRRTDEIFGDKIDLFSKFGSIYINSAYSNFVDVTANNNIEINGIIKSNIPNMKSHVSIESLNGSILLDNNSEIYSNNILLNAKSDILFGHLIGDNIELRSKEGSIVVSNSNIQNIKGNRVLFSAKKDVGSYFAPVKIDVNHLIIESAQTAVVNGQFNVQNINTNTQFVLPELEFLASAKNYTLNMNDFTIVDSGLFMDGVNLFSVSDDAVLINEDNEDLFSNNEAVSNDLTIN